MMRFFITGTDTNVGKTVISAWLSYHMKASYWKPIQSGTVEGFDSETVLKLAGVKIFPETYSLKAPLSPHLAAAMEGIEISLRKILLPETKDALVIEGAGGVLTPLNTQQTILDLISDLQIPAIVVARSTLGTINHTCLTLDALRSRSIPVVGVIMNGPFSPDNKQAIEHFGKTKVLAEIEPMSFLTKETIASIPFSSNLEEFLYDFCSN